MWRAGYDSSRVCMEMLHVFTLVLGGIEPAIVPSPGLQPSTLQPIALAVSVIAERLANSLGLHMAGSSEAVPYPPRNKAPLQVWLWLRLATVVR